MSTSLIEEALGHPAKIRVLRTLHKPGAGYMSVNQLAKITSLNVMTLSRALKSLQELGLTNYVKAGASQLWRLSEGYAVNVLGPILNAMENAPSLINQIKSVVMESKIPLWIEKIVLYGSVAREENHAGSDIDLFILQSKLSPTGEQYASAYLRMLSDSISKAFWMTPSFLSKTSPEFKKMTAELQKNINAGIVLYEKEQN